MLKATWKWAESRERKKKIGVRGIVESLFMENKDEKIV